MSYKLVHESGIEYDVMALEIPGNNPLMIHTLYVSNENIDGIGRALSRVYPDKCIRIHIFARNKAVYMNGERISVYSFPDDFYTNLTEEEIKKTKIFCTESREWV